jgi:hypothetical protein
MLPVSRKCIAVLTNEHVESTELGHALRLAGLRIMKDVDRNPAVNHFQPVGIMVAMSKNCPKVSVPMAQIL